MEAYLSKYMIRPQLEIAVRDFTEYGLGKIELGEGTVTHEGLGYYQGRYGLALG